MQNGDSLNIGDYLSYGYDALAVPDGAVIIPVPGDPGKYYVFHINEDYVDDLPFTNLLITTKLYCDEVDMSFDNGKGGVINGKKDVLILSDTLVNNGIEAVKHGNGKDWWLLCHKYGSNRYYTFLVDETGIHGPYTQDIGMVIRS